MPNYSVNDIAKLARRHGYEQVEVNLRDENRMVSWRHGWKCGGVRINIYFTTGTVATCLDHPKRGKGQLFRRNMTYADLEDIFDNPRVHTDTGYHRLGDGVKISGDRVAELSMYGHNFENDDIHNEFLNNDYYPIDTNFESISLGFDCFFILENDGTTMWSSGLPDGLYKKLKGRQSWLPRPEIVEIGKRSCHSYFIQFADGQKQWCDVPNELDKLLKEKETVDVIAIGDADNYYVKFQDGSEHWSLPVKLSNLLNGRNGNRRGKPHLNLAEVARVSLGSNNDYAVKFTDGSIKSFCGKPGYCREFDRILNKADVKHVEIGPGKDFVIIG